MTTTVYTDGACLGNPGGPGGWAWAIPGGAFAYGPAEDTTNQRMELTAVLHAVQANPGPLKIVSDSKYVVDCFRERWYVRWESNGWKASGRKQVGNQDLFRPLVDAYHDRGEDISFEWVKGHAGDPTNDLVDRLANQAARTQTAASGTKPPATLGEPDTAGPRPTSTRNGRDLSTLTGWRLIVLGLRPPDLGGYDPTNPVASTLRRKLTEILTGQLAVHPDVHLLTGLALGTEQIAAEAAIEAGVSYTAVLAYPDPDSKWPKASRQRYRGLLSNATTTITLTTKKPKTTQEFGKAAGRRNGELINAAHGAIVVSDGKDRRLEDAITALERRIPDDIWLIPRPEEPR